MSRTKSLRIPKG